MDLVIVTPAGELFRGEAEKVSLPGINGNFTILPRHAALISALGEGGVGYRTNGEEKTLPVKNGFVEVNRNVVTVCAEQ